MLENTTVGTMRSRLLILLGPGLLVSSGAVIAYLVSLGVPSLGFGKWKLLTCGILGIALLSSGFFLHRKAANDFSSSGRPYWRTVLFVSIAVLVGPSLTVFLVEMAVGVYLRASTPTPLLVLPANSKVSYHTSEFQYTAETNAIGIRDREVDLQCRPGLRVLAIGDSFTYGWGVDLAKSWPKVLEYRLQAAGLDAEVLNLGCPGTSVDAYAEIAVRAIPLLKPDLVLIGVLQGDDVKQLDLGETAQKVVDSLGSRQRSQSGTERFFPNLNELRSRIRVRKPSVISAEEMRAEWRRLASQIRDRLNVEETQRFGALDAEVKAMLMDGDLNPWEVYFAVKHPDYMAFTLNPERAEVRRARELMASSLVRIKDAGEQERAKMVVLSVPSGCYVCAKALTYKRRIGFRLEDAALRSDAPDEVISSACQRAGVDFLSITSDFRQAAAARDLYFDFDGHFNSEGHSLFAGCVMDLLLRREKLNAVLPK